MAREVGAVAFGVAFPIVSFIASAAGAIEEASAFTIAEWSGVGLIRFYGFAAARLAGDGWGWLQYCGLSPRRSSAPS